MRIWRVSFWIPTPTNVWLIDGPDGLTAIDAAMPWCGPAIVSAAAGIGRPLRRVVITHAHPDHAGAMAFLHRKIGAEIVAHRDDIPYLTGQASMADLPGSWICRTILRVGQRLGVLASTPVRAVTAVDDGDVVAGMQVVHTPGHTPGSISLFHSETGSLFCGDNMATTFCIPHLGNRVFTLDPVLRDRTLRKCIDLPSRHLLPGHGPDWKGDVGGMLRRLLESR